MLIAISILAILTECAILSICAKSHTKKAQKSPAKPISEDGPSIKLMKREDSYKNYPEFYPRGADRRFSAIEMNKVKEPSSRRKRPPKRKQKEEESDNQADEKDNKASERDIRRSQNNDTRKEMDNKADEDGKKIVGKDKKADQKGNKIDGIDKKTDEKENKIDSKAAKAEENDNKIDVNDKKANEKDKQPLHKDNKEDDNAKNKKETTKSEDNSNVSDLKAPNAQRALERQQKRDPTIPVEHIEKDEIEMSQKLKPTDFTQRPKLLGKCKNMVNNLGKNVNNLMNKLDEKLSQKENSAGSNVDATNHSNLPPQQAFKGDLPANNSNASSLPSTVPKNQKHVRRPEIKAGALDKSDDESERIQRHFVKVSVSED
ncbi:unnamed protein product [Bursaphelenchus okinawaensis]|uniref:Uncharacterized protein n=1 Tax=Bursaphelenchus okinawaensis TaxID=465554 RepID=A0A811K0T0_9BILA|nr:unnamed protein product [Bursaphelenchus okinawaensis]CAG9088446.1 unnamed protein product [Bursaphelenchus okinawaensis]